MMSARQKRLVTDWDDVPIIMDIPYAARIIGVTPESLVKRCQRGTFPAYHEGKLWRITKDALLRHIEVNSVMPAHSKKDKMG